jgi:hypothetical protein
MLKKVLLPADASRRYHPKFLLLMENHPPKPSCQIPKPRIPKSRIPKSQPSCQILLR